MPRGDHSSGDAFSSNSPVSTFGSPPPAGTTAIFVLAWKKNRSPAAVSKAIREPSGDQTGLVSGPNWPATLVRLRSATFRTYRSAVSRSAIAGVRAVAKAIFVPSGDQANRLKPL